MIDYRKKRCFQPERNLFGICEETEIKYILKPGRQQFRKLTSSVLQGLAYLLSNGFCHGDIKPSNILCLKKQRIIEFKLADCKHQHM